MNRRDVLMGFLATLASAVLAAPRLSAAYAHPLAGPARKLQPLLPSNGALFGRFPLVEVGGVLLSEEEVEHARRVTAELDKRIGSA